MSPSFDTHKYIKALVAKGLKEPQAELIVTTIVKTREFDLSKLVTKEQFVQFQSYTKEQFTKIEGEVLLIKKDIDLLRQEMKAEISNIKFDILKWIIPLILTNTLALLGIIVTLFISK